MHESKKTQLPEHIFEAYEDAILNQWEAHELTRERAKMLLEEFYRDYERKEED